MKSVVERFIEAYPKIFFACHLRHVRDSGSGRVLSARQASILDHLDGTVPRQVHELAEHLGVTASTASLQLDDLERAGFVKRSRHPRDRRRTNVRLTRAGERVKGQQKVLDRERVAALLGRLTAAERAEVVAALEKLAATAGGLKGEWS
jgi:DNA-binding MarR family transcriptional regulator